MFTGKFIQTQGLIEGHFQDRYYLKNEIISNFNIDITWHCVNYKILNYENFVCKGGERFL